MKGILQFDLDTHEGKLAHKRAISGTDAYLVLHNLAYTTIRNMIKYQELDEKQLAIVEKIQSDLYDYMNKYGIDLADLE